MKAFLMTTVLAFLLCGCNSSEDYKVIRTEVVKEHDKVMLDTERANENRLKLDRLLMRMDSLKAADPALDTATEKKEIVRIGIRLATADLEMDKWMKEFDAELGQKSNDEAVAYFRNEKVKLKSLDTLFKDALRESGEYLRKFE